MRPIRICLSPREPPLAADAVLAAGDAVPALSAATRRGLARGAELRAAAGEGWLVVLGPTEDLPWADGVRYLGREGELLVPTTSTVAPLPGLVAAAVRRVAPDAALIVVLEDTILCGPAPVFGASVTALEALA
jgi:hypothetical protein